MVVDVGRAQSRLARDLRYSPFIPDLSISEKGLSQQNLKTFWHAESWPEILRLLVETSTLESATPTEPSVKCKAKKLFELCSKPNGEICMVGRGLTRLRAASRLGDEEATIERAREN